MKRFFTTLCSIIIAGLITADAQTTFTDDFSKDNDYLAKGVGTTGWDGILLNKGFTAGAAGATAEIKALKAADGVLTFSTVNSWWAGDYDNGIMLYKEVKANTDFEMTVKITGGMPSQGGTTVAYMMPGLMARVVGDDKWVKDSAGFVAVQAFDQYDVGMQVRSATGAGSRGSEEHWTAVDDNFENITTTLYPYLKLSRKGNVFTGAVSKDGTAWFSLGDYDRADMAGRNLHIGIINCTYTENEGSITFDDFKAKADFVKAATTGISQEQNLVKDISLFYNKSNRAIEFNTKGSIRMVDVIAVDGRIVKSDKNLSGSRFNVNDLKTGIYIIKASNSIGQQVSKKLMIY